MRLQVKLWCSEVESDAMDPLDHEITAADIDRRVGDRIRRRRILMGLTQDQLGDALDISYQQIQKYETGANRVSAGRLYLIARKLDVSPGWFFDSDQSDSETDLLYNSGSSRLVMDFVRGFARIEDERIKTLIVSLVRSIAEKDEKVETPESVSENSPMAN